jgi:hypothetical protein
VHSPVVAASISAISAIAAYAQIKEAGLTLYFLLLAFVALSAGIVSAARFGKKRDRLRKRLLIQQLLRSPETKLPVVEDLIGTFSAALKAQSLVARLNEGRQAKMLAFLNVEGQLGALLDIGARENLEVGTPLLALRVDPDTNGGDFVESLLCSLTVTYVQVSGNLAQARVLHQAGSPSYWTGVRKDLRQAQRVRPPANFVRPLVPRELSGLSRESLLSIVTQLESVRHSLRESLELSRRQVGKD